MSRHINHFHLRIVQPWHNRPFILHGTLLTFLESSRFITHPIHNIVRQPQLLALRLVAHRIHLAVPAAHLLVAAPENIAQLIVAKSDPLRQFQRAEETVDGLNHLLFQSLPYSLLLGRKILESLFGQPPEQLVHSHPPMLSVTP